MTESLVLLLHTGFVLIRKRPQQTSLPDILELVEFLLCIMSKCIVVSQSSELRIIGAHDFKITEVSYVVFTDFLFY